MEPVTLETPHDLRPLAIGTGATAVAWAWLGRLENSRAVVFASLREHALLILVVLVYAAIIAALSPLLGRTLHFAVDPSGILRTIGTVTIWFLLLSGVAGVLSAAARRGGGRPLDAARRWLREDALRADRLLGGTLCVALMTIFAWNFTFAKAVIPLLHKYDWDPALSGFGQSLHFGRHAWEWLQPVVGYPAITSLLSLVYAGWFLVLYGVNTWQAFSVQDRALRMQYLFCSLLLWILLGNVGGTLMASGGPVYYGRITGLPDPYAPLIHYLDTVNASWPVWSRAIQEKIWASYVATGHDGFAGNFIAAMPSLHVATSTSFYLVARAQWPRLAWAFGAFLAVIVVGSIHLGWHYAADDYAAILGALLLWHLSGAIVRCRPVAWLLWGTEPATPIMRGMPRRAPTTAA